MLIKELNAKTQRRKVLKAEMRLCVKYFRNRINKSETLPKNRKEFLNPPMEKKTKNINFFVAKSKNMCYNIKRTSGRYQILPR